MVVFTKTDKTLLDRAARALEAGAAALEKQHGPVWSATAEGKKAKLGYDRLQRDTRDLRALARRLEEGLPTVAYPTGGQTTELKTG